MAGKINKTQFLSKFDKNSDFNFYGTTTVDMAVPFNPINAHGPTRIDTSYGYDGLINSDYISLVFNPLYHDMMDSVIGYEENTTLRFLSSEIKYLHKLDAADFKVNIMNIANYPIFNNFLERTAIDFKLGFENMHVSEYDIYKSAFLRTGIGLAFNVLSSADVYALVKADAETINLDKGYYLGTGFKTGFKIQEGNFAKTIINFNYLFGYSGQKTNCVFIDFYQGFYITRNFSLRTRGEYYFKEGTGKIQGGVSISF
jgi:hypothetical protein